jgi:hypothetical protein
LNRVAFPAWHELPAEGDAKRYEVVVFMLDLSDREKPVLSQALRLTAPEDPAQKIVFLDLSPDGKRLLATMDSRVMESDAAGKEEPKMRFEVDEWAWRLARFAPDSIGIVCAIQVRNAERSKLVFQEKPGAPLREIAQLDGFPATIPVFRWLARDRLRVYDVMQDAIRLVEVNTDGANRVEKYLDPVSLKRQQELADLEYRLQSARAMPEGKDRDAKIAAIRGTLGGANDLDKTLEAEWDKVDDWKTLPAKTDVPEPPAKEDEEEGKKP